MKQKSKRTNSNKPICSKNNNEYVGAERIGTRPIPTMPAYNKGITLIALILTIIVLLILAVVTISAVTGNGIIAHAKNARDLYGSKSEEENALLQNYLEQLNKETNGNGGSSDENKKIDGITVKGSLNAIISTTTNTPLTDDFGNKITVPAGFKIITKTDTENTDLNYTADDINVTKGIVVEDGEGNQFVWIPVGTIYTNTEKTESKTITLGRYADFTKTNNVYTPVQNADNYSTATDVNLFTEYTEANFNKNFDIAIARDIGDFCNKTITSGGYYIGRYEARTENETNSSSNTLETVTLKANDYIYKLEQKQASERCKSMYVDKTFISDLTNSYAWDTAIIFIQEFGGDIIEKGYSYLGVKGEACYAYVCYESSYGNKGTSGDNYTGMRDVMCNIYDMASNCFEWSTEATWDDDNPSVIRGGYATDSLSTVYYTSARNMRGRN